MAIYIDRSLTIHLGIHFSLDINDILELGTGEGAITLLFLMMFSLNVNLSFICNVTDLYASLRNTIIFQNKYTASIYKNVWLCQFFYQRLGQIFRHVLFFLYFFDLRLLWLPLWHLQACFKISIYNWTRVLYGSNYILEHLSFRLPVPIYFFIFI